MGGVAAVIAGLAAVSTKVGFLPVFLLYVLPYTVTNFWLVLYTWLQHTDMDVRHFIPHYHAKEATDALAAAFPDIYLYDDTPLHEALWRISKDCVAVKEHGDQFVFHSTEKTF